MIDAHNQLLHRLGAHRVPHSGRTLLDHLKGTYELLTQWGSTETTCIAGLFHSVYGTRTFAPSLLGHDRREKIRGVLGAEAEQLVYWFSICDRNSFFENIGAETISLRNEADGGSVAVSSQMLNALVEIEIANTVEQVPHKKRISSKVMDVYTRQCLAARPVISDRAYTQCVRVLENHQPNMRRDRR